MELFPRIKRIAIANTVDKEGDVQTNLQVVLEVKFTEEIGRGLADIARSDYLKCEIYEFQRKLALNGASTDPQPQASRDLFTPPPQSEIDLLKERVRDLWPQFAAEKDQKVQDGLNTQAMACEDRLLALGVVVELGDHTSEDEAERNRVEFRDAEDDELITSDSDIRDRLALGDLEPTKKLALERNLEDIAKTLGARGWVLVDNPSIDPNHPEEPKIWVTKDEVEEHAAIQAARDTAEAAEPPKKSRSKKATKAAA